MFLAFHLLLLAASQTFFLAHNLMSIQSAPAQSRVASGNSRLHGESFLAGNSKSKPQKNRSTCWRPNRSPLGLS
jgi:hypothetical protein